MEKQDQLHTLRQRLYLANKGAVLAVALSAQAYQGIRVNSGQALLSMLTMKAADHLRLATNALSSGHYYSVPILLRSALDSIGVLCLTSRNDSELKRWAFLTYVSDREPSVDPAQLRETRAEFYTRARSAYDGLLSQDRHVQPVRDIIREFNAHVHPGLEGLLEIAGIPLELDELLGVEVAKVLATAQGDLNKAVGLLDLAGQYSRPKTRLKPISEKETRDFDFGYLDEGLMDDYSSMLHAATHHLLDIADFIFRGRAPAKLKKAVKEWRTRSLSAFKAYEKQ